LPSDENDGAPLAGFDDKGFPLLDYAALGYDKIEIIGYDHVFRIVDGVATWIVFRRTKSSGIIINAASTDWCSSEGMGNEDVKKNHPQYDPQVVEEGECVLNRRDCPEPSHTTLVGIQ